MEGPWGQQPSGWGELALSPLAGGVTGQKGAPASCQAPHAELLKFSLPLPHPHPHPPASGRGLTEEEGEDPSGNFHSHPQGLASGFGNRSCPPGTLAPTPLLLPHPGGRERKGEGAAGRWGLRIPRHSSSYVKQEEPLPPQLIKTSGQRLQMKGPCHFPCK